MISRRVTVWGPLQHNADGGKDVLTMEGFERYGCWSSRLSSSPGRPS